MLYKRVNFYLENGNLGHKQIPYAVYNSFQSNPIGVQPAFTKAFNLFPESPKRGSQKVLHKERHVYTNVV